MIDTIDYRGRLWRSGVRGARESIMLNDPVDIRPPRTPPEPYPTTSVAPRTVAFEFIEVQT